MSKHCEELHNMVYGLDRIRFPLGESSIPKNGIYIFFEKNESGHGGDRIVRIVTHWGEGNLRTRLDEHFLNQNKDRSIFRKKCLTGYA
ncbi:hypothetical protein [Clostridium algidicarnis]|uniref:hypothetical protein n=1 Tax=Clostridium algidicarnis TaxID=37659 RepID=UPI001628EEC8|nr:hypothetical protein [Clostridium algidicarnis]MBB6696665.1 hypothetical protein [Clostridium algidicarnis]